MSKNGKQLTRLQVSLGNLVQTSINSWLCMIQVLLQ